MSVLGDLEQRLNIVQIEFQDIAKVDFSDIKGVDNSTPAFKVPEPMPTIVVPNIKQSTFGQLDQAWGVSHGTASELYYKLCNDIPKFSKTEIGIVQKILNGMACGTITKNTVNSLFNALLREKDSETI